LWEKVDRRDSAETDEGCSRERRRLTPLEHPSSVAFGDTFSHKGRRGSLDPDASRFATNPIAIALNPQRSAPAFPAAP